MTIQPLQSSFNRPYQETEFLYQFFSTLKNPHLSLVCKFWHEINSSSRTYELILNMYNQEKFMARFDTKLSFLSNDCIMQVKQIFADVWKLVKSAGIEIDVEQARVKDYLAPLELNPIMKMVKGEESLIALFKALCIIIPDIGDLSPLNGKTIRIWMQASPEKLQTVTKLDLSNLKLAIFPPEIGLLTHLESLNLTDKKLSVLLQEIGLLVNLKRLYLSNNQLIFLPLALCQLTQLEWLDLSENQLTALPSALHQLTQLKQLYLSNNQLTDLPPDLCQLTQLEWLYLEHNQLTTLPPGMGRLTKLKWLYLGSNELTEFPLEICQLPDLEKLGLAHNQLEALPESIHQLTKLNQLNLDNNQLTILPYCLRTLSDKGQLYCKGNPSLNDKPKEQWFSNPGRCIVS